MPPGPTRRTVLATLGAGLAGCTGGPGGRTPGPVETRTFPDGSYRGPLVSAHEHVSGPRRFELSEERLSWYVRWMERNRVARVMAITPTDLIPLVEGYREDLIPYLFAHGYLRGSRADLAERLRETVERYEVIEGLGEFALSYFHGEGGEVPLPPDAPELLAVYDLAAELDLPVMVHAAEPWRFPADVRRSWDSWLDCPTIDQMANAYSHNRETTFLVHGTYFGHRVPMSRGEMAARALADHPNLYYDVSHVSPYAYAAGPGGHGSMSRAEFEAKMNETGVAYHADRYYDELRPLLESYSDRVLWGMDASLAWHYNRWALDVWIDVGRALLGRIPPDDARNVGYRTAEDLFDIEVEA